MEINEFEIVLKRTKEELVRKKIIFIEYLSIFLTIACFFLSGYLALEDYSMTALAVSADSFLDLLVHLTVLWRYFKPLEDDSTNRDKFANLTLSLLFLTSSFCIEFESILSLVHKKLPIPSLTYIYISVAQSIIFNLLSIYKFLLCLEISQNSALKTSGIDSFIAGISNFTMCLSMGIFILNKKIWYLDGAFGILIGSLVFIYGINLLIQVFLISNKPVNQN